MAPLRQREDFGRFVGGQDRTLPVCQQSYEGPLLFRTPLHQQYLRTSEGRGFPGGWRFTGHDTQGLAEAGSEIPRIQLGLTR